MRIRMFGMSPDGEIVRDGAEVFEGETALEIVRAMMVKNPFASGQTEVAFMRATLARIWKSGVTLPDDLNEACEAFLAHLKEFELAEEIAATEPLTDLTVRLVGENGNAFFILGRVRAALRKGGYPQTFIEQFTSEATAGDYDHLLQTVMKYVNVE